MMKNLQLDISNNRISIIETILLLTIFTIPIWPRYAMIYVKGLPDINLTRILIVLLIYLWIIILLGPNNQYSKNIKEKIKANKDLFCCLVLFFALRYYKVLSSSEFSSSFYKVTDEFVTWFLIFLVGLTVWQSPQQIIRALLVMVASSLVVTLFGLYEAYLGYNILSDIIQAPTEHVEKALEAKYRGGYRIQSTFLNPLVLAEYLLFIIPISIVVLFKYRNLFIRGICFIVVILALINILVTESRGALVVMLVMIYVFLIFELLAKRKRQTGIHQMFTIVVLIPILTCILILFFPLASHLIVGKTEMETVSSIARFEQLKVCISYIAGRPLFGYGIGQSGVIATFLRSTSIDNYLLLLAMESGLFPLILFLYVIIRFIKLSHIIYNKLYGTKKAIAGALGLSVFGFAVFMNMLSIAEIFPLLFVLFAMLLSLKNLSDDSRKSLSIVERTMNLP